MAVKLTKQQKKLLKLAILTEAGRKGDKELFLFDEIASVDSKVDIVEDSLTKKIEDISIKKGEQGDKGDVGPRGAPGVKGDKGDRGYAVVGPRGDTGTKGDRGEKGDKGDAGVPGKDGSPDMAEDIRNKLELLDGEERLDKKYIKGLEELESKIAKSSSKVVPGGLTRGAAEDSFVQFTNGPRRITVSATAPITPQTYDFWLDTS